VYGIPHANIAQIQGATSSWTIEINSANSGKSVVAQLMTNSYQSLPEEGGEIPWHYSSKAKVEKK
jgi:hypothetical protein